MHINTTKDHLFLSILCHAMTPEEVTQLYKTYIEKYLKSIHESAIKMVDEEAPVGELDSEARQEVSKALKKVSISLGVVLSAVETELSGMVIRSRMMEEPEEAHRVLEDYLALYEGMLAIEFKNFAEKLIGSEEMVRHYIKDRVNIKGKRVYPGEKSSHYLLNLSPGSELLKKDLTPEIADRVIGMKANFKVVKGLSEKMASEEALSGILDVVEYCLGRIGQAG